MSRHKLQTSKLSEVLRRNPEIDISGLLKPKIRRKRAPGEPSKLEAKFAQYWDGPLLEMEYQFHPTRKWKADFAHLATRTLIEIEGGAFCGGRHTRGVGFLNDIEKYLEATYLGWTVVRLGQKQINRADIRRLSEWIQAKTN